MYIYIYIHAHIPKNTIFSFRRARISLPMTTYPSAREDTREKEEDKEEDEDKDRGRLISSS